MKDFDLKKYLTEGRLLKENTDSELMSSLNKAKDICWDLYDKDVTDKIDLHQLAEDLEDWRDNHEDLHDLRSFLANTIEDLLNIYTEFRGEELMDTLQSSLKLANILYKEEEESYSEEEEEYSDEEKSQIQQKQDRETQIDQQDEEIYEKLLQAIIPSFSDTSSGYKIFPQSTFKSISIYHPDLLNSVFVGIKSENYNRDGSLSFIQVHDGSGYFGESEMDKNFEANDIQGVINHLKKYLTESRL